MMIEGKFVHSDGKYYYGFNRETRGLFNLGLIRFILNEVVPNVLDGDTVTFWIKRSGEDAVRPSSSA
jgi:hypothetical protein